MNINKLKGKIVENGLSIEKIAKKVDIHASTLYRKISKGGDNLTIKEIKVLIKELNLTEKEIKEIFFNKLVA